MSQLDSATVRHLLAAERALEQARKSMRLAERRPDGPDLDKAWDAMETLSLIVQAERLERDE